jgi:hypothetical protein
MPSRFKRSLPVLRSELQCNAYLREGAGLPTNLVQTDVTVEIFKLLKYYQYKKKEGAATNRLNGKDKLTACGGYQDYEDNHLTELKFK